MGERSVLFCLLKTDHVGIGVENGLRSEYGVSNVGQGIKNQSTQAKRRAMSRSILVRVTIGAAIAAGLLFGSSIVSNATGVSRPIMLHDDCDPTTFNATVGPGTCIGSGKTTFDKFIAQVMQHQTAFLWFFAPGQSGV